MTTEQTPSADEDRIIQLKAPEKHSEWILSVDCFVELYINVFIDVSLTVSCIFVYTAGCLNVGDNLVSPDKI